MAACGLARAEVEGLPTSVTTDIRCDTPPASAMISPAAPEMMVQTLDFLTEPGGLLYCVLLNKVGTDSWPATSIDVAKRERFGDVTLAGSCGDRG